MELTREHSDMKLGDVVTLGTEQDTVVTLVITSFISSFSQKGTGKIIPVIN